MRTKLLYCETNWLMGLIYQQDQAALDLFDHCLGGQVEIALPAFCLGEAITSFHGSERERKLLSQTLQTQIDQSVRSRAENARDLARHLSNARLANDRLINDLSARLADIITRAPNPLRLVVLDAPVLTNSFTLAQELRLSRMDATVLGSILSDAANLGTCSLGFLSENTKDFGKEPVVERLKEAGIRYFGKTGNALQWLLHAA